MMGSRIIAGVAVLALAACGSSWPITGARADAGSDVKGSPMNWLG
jgi:hypothetical protein